jgi:hypothetical protein
MLSMRRPTFTVLLAALWGTVAFAQAGERVALHWTVAAGASSCIDESALKAAVEARLGHPVFSTDAFDRVLEGNIDRSRKGGFTVVLSMRTHEGALLGRRSIHSRKEDCEALSTAVPLLVALLVDPTAPLGEPAEVEPEPASVPLEPPPAIVEAPSPPEPRLFLGAGVIVWAGLLPGAAVGPRLTLRGRINTLLSVEAVVDSAPHAVAADPSGGSLLLWMIGGGANACAGWTPRSPLRLEACLQLHAAAVVAKGRAFEADNAAYVRPEAWPGLEARARVSSSWLWGELVLGAGVPVVRDRFYLELPDGQQRTLHRAGSVLGWAALELGF